ncbi:hypothetical protein UlMin_001601 [Ulmus minor]
MTGVLKLPVVDLCSPDRPSSAASIRQACIDYGIFYLVNHGVEEELIQAVFEESKKLFSLPSDEKNKLACKHLRGYTPVNPNNKGNAKESYYIGPLEDVSAQVILNQWPSEEILPLWRPTMETYYRKVLDAGKRLLELIAMALNLDEDFFQRIGAVDKSASHLRILHYPDAVGSSDEETYGISAHSDLGTITLLASDGVQGLQVCRENIKKPQVWEDVPHLDGALIINMGDMMERWTNCLFRSTLHRVRPAGRKRYSAAFFIDPIDDCIVECLETCCSKSSPPRFPPIRSGDYLKEKLETYASQGGLVRTLSFEGS